MLRIHQHTSTEAIRSYYTSADYYAEESQGVWFGRGAEQLGLRGEVENTDFDALCHNRNPATGAALTARTRADRTVAYDFNFHPPKSLSALYAITGDDRLREAVEAAVRDTMMAIEAEMKTRVRRGGRDEERETGNLLGAIYTHTTSRPVDGIPDPHLHCHAVVFNATFDPVEQSFKAGQFRDLKRDAPYFEAIFHSHLTRRVADLGYPVERTAKGWEVAGVSPQIIRAFSRRTTQIEKLAAEKGITDPTAIDQLGARTREGKATQFSPEELRTVWRDRLAPADRDALAALRASALGQPAPVPAERTADQAAAYAIAHCFVRDSVVPEKQLLAEALRFGVGAVTPAEVKTALNAHGVIRADIGGRTVVTTPEVLAEEQRMVAFARSGRGISDPLGGGIPHEFRREFLNDGQRRAVQHLLESPDQVMLIRGKAGVGKSTLLKEAIEAIEARGHRVFAFAPTADASRGVLRQEGFADADTVARLILDNRLHAAIANQVLLIDEAGLIGTRTLAAVFDLARNQNARVILVGDTSQHRGVERGAALRILEDQAGLPAVELREVQRQRDGYKRAVEDLAAGRSTEGFDRLNAMGWVTELPDAAARSAALAADYTRHTAAGEHVLAVAPTHAEGDRITAAIRTALRGAGRLTGNEHHVDRLVPLHRTTAEQGRAELYTPGDVAQFSQNAPGFRRGERLTVVSAGANGVRVRAADGSERDLPLNLAGRFQLYRADTLPLVAGDRVRITHNGTSKDGHRLNNGSLYTVAGFTPDEGNIRLDNGWVIDRGYGHLAHGFVVTSVASQGKTVDRVLIGQSQESGPAASREQFYVAVSRGRHGARLYVDDKAAVRTAIGRSDRPVSAGELAARAIRPNDRHRRDLLRRVGHRIRQAAAILTRPWWHQSRTHLNADHQPERRVYGRHAEFS